MLKILFSANKAATKSSGMDHNYSWLSEGVRNCVCSEPQLWHWICWSTDYSFCQAHTSPPACHKTAIHRHKNRAVSAGWDQRSVSSSHLHLWEMREPNLRSLQNTGQIQRNRRSTDREEQQKSWLSLLLLSLYGLTFDSLFCSENLAHTFMELIRSIYGITVSHLQSQFKPSWQLSSTQQLTRSPPPKVRWEGESEKQVKKACGLT